MDTKMPRSVGRPKGSVKTDGGKQIRFSARFSPEIDEMIQSGLQYNKDGENLNKTEFIEQAIRHYYNSLKEQHTDKRSLTVELDEPRGTDYVDHILDLWIRQTTFKSNSHIFLRIMRIAQYYDEIEYKYRADPHNLTLNELRFLMVLKRSGANGGMTPSGIKRSLLVSLGAVSKQLERLEKKGFIERKVDPEDRRSIQVALTPEGNQLVTSIVSDPQMDPARIIDDSFQEDEKMILEHLLRKLLVMLEQDFKDFFVK